MRHDGGHGRAERPAPLEPFSGCGHSVPMPVIPRRHAVDIRAPHYLATPEKHALSIDVAQRHPAYS